MSAAPEKIALVEELASLQRLAIAGETGEVDSHAALGEIAQRLGHLAGERGAAVWQPITTAPRDGTPVDLWHVRGFRIVETWWDAEDECWSCVMEDSDFTHWVPMPQGPRALR